MAYTGRCWYCGSEDVEDYSDGSHECMECRMTWGGRQYVQQPTYHRTYFREGKTNNGNGQCVLIVRSGVIKVRKIR